MTGIKTCTFAAVHMAVAFTVAFAMTGDWRVGGALALVEPAVNTLAFYVHERSWMRWHRVRSSFSPACYRPPDGVCP